MKIEVAKALANAAAEIGVDMDIREGYSGRGMYGKTTVGVICEDWPILLQCAALAGARVQEAEHEDEDSTLTLDEFVDGLIISHDSMGHRLIAY
jgi:hypothetical protein